MFRNSERIFISDRVSLRTNGWGETFSTVGVALLAVSLRYIDLYRAAAKQQKQILGN